MRVFLCFGFATNLKTSFSFRFLYFHLHLYSFMFAFKAIVIAFLFVHILDMDGRRLCTKNVNIRQNISFERNDILIGHSCNSIP